MPRKEKAAPKPKKVYKPGHEPGPVTVIDCRGLNLELHPLKKRDIKPPPKER